MDADDLYGLPLERFTPERNKLAKERKEPEIAKLPKPSVAAWAVNQLVRTQPKALTALFKAGDGLRKAQDKVLAGRGDAGDLRAGVEREREAVSGLVAQARGLLNSDGHELSQTVLDRVSDTLHAAALDDDAREQVRAGTLVRELRHAGLGMAAGMGAVPSGRRAPKREPAARKVREPGKPPEPPAPRKPDRREARIAAADARRRVDLAERALRAAVERRDRAQEALDAAKADVKAAQAEAKAAAAAQAKLVS